MILCLRSVAQHGNGGILKPQALEGLYLRHGDGCCSVTDGLATATSALEIR